MSTSVISVRGLHKTYRTRVETDGFWAGLRSLVAPEYEDHPALAGIDLELQSGECLGLLGPNGAGKSTFIKILCGIQQPSTGSASVLGFHPHKRPLGLYRQIGVVFGHKSSLWWDLPVQRSFDLARRLYEIDEDVYRRNLKALIEALTLGHVLDRPVRVLSLGERVKAELAMNLLHDPALLLLDEPTVGLDLDAKAEIRGYLNRARESRGLAILLTSHDMGDIEACCDRVVLLNEGRIGYEGNPTELRREFRRDVRVVLTSEHGLFTPEAAAQVKELVVHAGLAAEAIMQDAGEPRSSITIAVPREHAKDVVAALVSTVDATLEVMQPTLEEVVLERFRQWRGRA